MNIIKFFKDSFFGRLVELTITGTRVRICQGRKTPEYELPKTFQNYSFLNHTEEMAGWLQAILREEKVQIRRCRIVLDSGQVYLRTVKLPVMTVEEQRNWVHWEGSQCVPFEPGTYQAVLLSWTNSVYSRLVQENRVTVDADLSAKRQTTEEVKLQDFLLIAIPLEILEALQQFAGFLKAKIEEVTVLGPKQVVLPVNLLPVASGKELMRKRGYQTAMVVCFLLSVVLAVRGGISWYRTKSAWLEAERQLVPYSLVKTAYEENKQADYQIRQYQEKLQYISQTGPVWTPALRAIGSMIPEGCWLEELQQKHEPAGRLEMKGCAIKLTQRLVDRGTKRIVVKGSGDNSKKVVSFVLLAELASKRKGARP